MAYKNREDQIAAQRRHYLKNKVAICKKNNERREKTKKWWKEYKSTLKCKTCGENHPACISFHHRDSSTKEEGLSDAVCRRGWGKDKIMKEIAKCDIICSNCHRKIHWVQ